MTNFHSKLTSSSLTAMALVFAAAGCSQFDLKNNIPWGVGSDGKFESPMQVVPFWTTGVQTQDDKGLRGFGARIYFYGKNPNKPVKVKGMLVIYAYDEQGHDPKNPTPDRKYVFTPEQFKAKFSKTELGPSYSIWIPWDEVGGPTKQISLIARFTSERGEMVGSDETKVLLPGATAESSSPTSSTMAAQQPIPMTPSLSALAKQFAVQPPSIVKTPDGMAATGGVANGTAAVGTVASGVVLASATSPIPQGTLVSEGSVGPGPDGFGAVQVRRMTTTTIPVAAGPQARMIQANPVSTVNATEVPQSSLRASMLASGAVPSAALANMRQQAASGAAVPNVPGAMGLNSAQNTYAGGATGNSPVAPNQVPPQYSQGFRQASGATTLSEVRSELETHRVLGGPNARLENVRDPLTQSPGAPLQRPSIVTVIGPKAEMAFDFESSALSFVVTFEDGVLL